MTTDRPPDLPRRNVLLFSGHMIDAPDRPEARFPASMERVAALAIAAKLDDLNTGRGDLAICSGACGGDLLFAEAALQRGARLEIYIPFHEPAFLAASVDFAGQRWHERFQAVRSHPHTTLHVMPVEYGALPDGADPYERNNLWMLESALRNGTEGVDFICLWNGKGGDGPGGTQHMMKEVEDRAGRVHWLDTTRLWSLPDASGEK